MKTANADDRERWALRGEPMALRPSIRMKDAVNSEMNEEIDPIPAAGYWAGEIGQAS